MEGESKGPHSIAATLRKSADLLQAIASNPRLEAELILMKVLEVDRTYLYTDPTHLLNEYQMQQWQNLVIARLQGQPLAYLLGKREFWSLELTVNPSVLIPRPETELLVETVLRILPKDQVCAVADLGTGSGAIALALAHERPLWKLMATDQSEAALGVARNNAQHLNIANVEFFQGDWCLALPHKQFTAIVSNPPYIAEGDTHLSQGDLPFEPESALVSGQDGLEAIRKIIAQARDYLLPEGWLMLEHGYDQQVAVIELMKASGYEKVQGFADLAGIPRVVIACRPDL